jgi:hypothetical protein
MSMKFTKLEKEKPTVIIPDPMSPVRRRKKYPISVKDGLTVGVCLSISLGTIMAFCIYIGFFWYLEQQRQIKGE